MSMCFDLSFLGLIGTDTHSSNIKQRGFALKEGLFRNPKDSNDDRFLGGVGVGVLEVELEKVARPQWKG